MLSLQEMFASEIEKAKITGVLIVIKNKSEIIEDLNKLNIKNTKLFFKMKKPFIGDRDSGIKCFMLGLSFPFHPDFSFR